MTVESLELLLKGYKKKKIELSSNEIMIYYLYPLISTNTVLLKNAFDSMPVNRRKKVSRLRNKEDQTQSILAYALLIFALKDYFGIDNELIFDRNQYGKPFLKSNNNVQFNISHCGKGVACAVSLKQVGIDIQDRTEVTDELIEFTCNSVQKSLIYNAQDREFEFIRIWSMKESYVKMIGIGLQDDMRNINVHNLDCFKQIVLVPNELVLSICS